MNFLPKTESSSSPSPSILTLPSNSTSFAPSFFGSLLPSFFSSRISSSFSFSPSSGTSRLSLPELQVHELNFRYGKRTILKNISFSISSSCLFAILGPNGSGKTTLLRCLNQQLTPNSGQVTFGTLDLLRISPERRAKFVAYAPQRAATNGLTVFDSVLLGRRPHRTWYSRQTDLQKTREVLERLNLTEKSNVPLNSLSGGELQKVALARVLAQEPQLIFLDEPTSALDWKNRAEILALLRQFAREDGLTIVLTIHDVNDALRFADRLLLLKHGEIVTETAPEDLTAETLSQVYGLPIEIHEIEGKRTALAFVD